MTTGELWVYERWGSQRKHPSAIQASATEMKRSLSSETERALAAARLAALSDAVGTRLLREEPVERMDGVTSTVDRSSTEGRLHALEAAVETRRKQ